MAAANTKSKGANSRLENLQSRQEGEQQIFPFCHRYRRQQETGRRSLPTNNSRSNMIISSSIELARMETREVEPLNGYEFQLKLSAARSISIHKMKETTSTSPKSSPLEEKFGAEEREGARTPRRMSHAACSVKALHSGGCLQRCQQRHWPISFEDLIIASQRAKMKPAMTTTTVMMTKFMFVFLTITSLAGFMLLQENQSVCGQTLAVDGHQTTMPISRYRSSGGASHQMPTALLTARRPAGAGFPQPLLAAQAVQSHNQNQNWQRSLSLQPPASSLSIDYDQNRDGASTQPLDQSLPLVRVAENDSAGFANRNATRTATTNTHAANNNLIMKSVRSIVGSSSIDSSKSNSSTAMARPTAAAAGTEDVCADRLCYGLPMGCLGSSPRSDQSSSSSRKLEQQPGSSSSRNNERCNVLVTSKRFIDPNRPVSRDIHFELIALPKSGVNSYAAVGFSETGRMQGLVSECLQHRDPKTQLQIIRLKHSYNVGGAYTNVPVRILSGVKHLGVTYENGYYQCRWVVESAVEFSYEALNGTTINRREDLGYKNYHILLASGDYNQVSDVKNIHDDRVSSVAPVSLAQTGHIKSLGSHILIRIHGTLMIAIWAGFVTLSIVLARYYKNEWSNSKINDLAIWFVAHRALMLASWFGSIIAVIFAYMYTETYHPGLHQVSGTTCLVLSTAQVLGGLFRPSLESGKRVYFNWAHFICGNLSYLFAMVCLITAAFLAPAHLPPLYIWAIVAFVGTYAITHLVMTIHQYIVHKSSKISITPMSDLNSTSSTSYTSCSFIADSYPKEVNSPFRQFMLGTLVTIIVIFIVLLISLVNIRWLI